MNSHERMRVYISVSEVSCAMEGENVLENYRRRKETQKCKRS